jgi:hypothetical protein
MLIVIILQVKAFARFSMSDSFVTITNCQSWPVRAKYFFNCMQVFFSVIDQVFACCYTIMFIYDC